MWQFLTRHWVIIVAIIYMISPLDFIPELLVPVLGPAVLVDDLVLIVLAIGYAIKVERDHQRKKSFEQKQVIDGEEVVRG